MDSTQIKVEWIKCHRDVCYFTETYVQIFNAHSKAGASGRGAATGAWIPFRLWPAQRQVLQDFVVNPYIIVLKARQLGMSWLTLSYALWLMLFYPAANIMLMSKRDDESIELLSNRLIEMHARLPEWLQAKRVLQESAHDFVLSNGSRAKAFPTSGGRRSSTSANCLARASSNTTVASGFSREFVIRLAAHPRLDENRAIFRGDSP